MSAEEWNAAVKAGLESMDDHGAQLSNQADNLPSSSQSPGHSPQPSPDSQQKDLGAAVPSQSQSHQTSKVTVTQPQQLQQPQMLGSQQDQQVSQSSDLTRSQSPVFRGSPRSTISSQEGKNKPNQSVTPVSSSGTIPYSSQNVHKVPLQYQHRLPHGVGQSLGLQSQVNHRLPKPRQVSPQRPVSKIITPNIPSTQQGMQIPLKSNTNVGVRAAFQTRPTGSVTQTFSRGSHQQVYHQQHLKQSLPQHHQRMPVGQRHLSPGTNVGSGNPQQMANRMVGPRFCHQKQQQNQPQQFARPHLHGPGGNQSRPQLPHHIQKQQPGFSQHSQNSSTMMLPGAQDRVNLLQKGNTSGMENDADGGDHSMSLMHEDEMYDDEYDESMQEGADYDPEYEGEEDEEEEDYDEDMEEEQYRMMNQSYRYDSSASDDLSEEESTLFEELSHLAPNDPRYEEIVNRLREKGVDRDEIEEIINPQRPAFNEVYGDEPYDEDEGEEDEEMEEAEETVSSSSYSQAERQLLPSQTETGMHQGTVSPSRGLPQRSHNQSHDTFPVSAQNVRATAGLQLGQSQQNLTQPGQTQPHQLNSSQSGHNQHHQCLSQPSSQGHAQRAHLQQRHPLPHLNLPPPSNISQLRPNSQQAQPPKHVANLNQHRKVFQSPMQTCSSTTSSDTSDWQHHGPRPPMAAKPVPSSAASLQPQKMNPPRQMGPNRLPMPGQQMGGTIRPAAQSHQGSTAGRPLLTNTTQGGQNPRGQMPSQQMGLAQGAQAQQSQQGAVIQPPMVRGVSPRAMPPQHMVRPGAPSPNVGHRPVGFPIQGNLRPRTMTAPNVRTNGPLGQLRAPIPANRASQSRLDVQHMQEMLDKQIMAKKGAAALPNQSQVGTEDQSHLSASSLPPPNTHVFQTPLPKQFLPPRRPVSQALPLGRHPRPAGTPQGMQPLKPRFNAPVRPRVPIPISQTMAPPLQQSQSAPQVRIGSFSQAGPSGQATSPNKPVGTQQGSLHPLNDSSKSVQEHRKISPAAIPSASSKPPSFNLDALSEAKLNLHSTRNGKLVPNTTYRIKSPIDQTIICAVWNGEKFVGANQENTKGSGQSTGASSQSQDSSNAVPKAKLNILPGGSNAFQDQFLLSLQSGAKQQESLNEPDTNSDNVENHPNQFDKSDSAQISQSTSQTTYVKPLSQASNDHKKSDKDDDDEDDDSIFKKPFSENEDLFRVCNNCGYTSKDFKRCDGCQKLHQGEMKIHCTKKTSGKVDTPSSQPSSSGCSSKKQEKKPSDRFREVMNKASFYGNKDASRGGYGRGAVTARRGLGRTKGGGLKGKPGLQTEEEEPDHQSSDEDSDDRRGMKRRQGRPKAKTTPLKKRSKKIDEPVTLTISSDEDEPSSTTYLLPGVSASPAHSAGSESPIFTTSHMNPVNAFGRFRRMRMEDEEGHSKLEKKLQQTQNKPSSMVPPDEELEEDEDEDGDEPAVYEIDIRSVRIGSMRTQPQQPMFISLHGVCFKCRSERTDEEFECEILCSEVEHVKFFAGQPQPVLFLFLSQECGEKVRSICHMEPGDEEYFDPCCTDMKQKMVVIIIESSSEMPLEMLRENLTLWADMNHQEDSDYLEELSEESANDLLIQSAPPVLTADIERGVLKFKKKYIYEGDAPHVQPRMPASPPEGMDNEEPDSTSSSPPDVRNHFFGAPIRLLLYPPPPARGIAIKTEDLMCLAEGEFLNDVVIDFYLQYLYKEKLSEANQKRTHIFSSFFYKRLTQRDRHSEKTEEDAKKSLPERRHARVKKWTKHVDLFSKDFIIVPINEHSHWFLAVICFPGLASPEVVPYIPSAIHRTDVDEASNDAGGSETGSVSKDEGGSSQETLIKHTVLGRQLSEDACNNSDEGKLVGQKQPCILMFDSLAGPSRNPNVKMLREYLQCEWDAKKSEQRQIAKIVRGSTPKVPQQSNFSDCGVFLLQYVESFFEDPIADFQIPMKGLQNWFPEELVLHKRRDIHELIMSLHQAYMEERGDRRILDIPFESTPQRPPPQMPMDIPNPNNHEHFLGKLDDESGAEGGALNKEDENSNSSAAWELVKPVPSPPFPVALQQNSMFEREESNQSPFLLSSHIQNEGEEEDESNEGMQLSGPIDHGREEESDRVDNTSGKDSESQSELTEEKPDDSEGTEIAFVVEQAETESEGLQSEREPNKGAEGDNEQSSTCETKAETSSTNFSKLPSSDKPNNNL